MVTHYITRKSKVMWQWVNIPIPPIRPSWDKKLESILISLMFPWKLNQQCSWQWLSVSSFQPADVTFIISAFNNMQGWVSGDPIPVTVISTIENLQLSDDGKLGKVVSWSQQYSSRTPYDLYSGSRSVNRKYDHSSYKFAHVCIMTDTKKLNQDKKNCRTNLPHPSDYSKIFSTGPFNH